ncbi:MAG: NCS2 family permease [Lachnospiraceae bacterium]
MLEKWFKLRENGTTVKTEILAGITTFMTMAYILAVNPSMLGSVEGMTPEAVFLATAIASAIGSLLMALLANYPFALAPGMGLNAYFTYTVCASFGMNIPFQVALLAVFIEGLIFIILSVTNVREAIFNAIPLTLKYAVSVGIGLFIAFIGFQGAHLVVNNDSTLVTYQHFASETFHTEGISAILALLGILITGILAYKKVKGSILIGILATWLLGILSEATGLYVPDAAAGFYSVYPSFSLPNLAALGDTFGKCFQVDFSAVKILDFIVVIFAFLFVDMFDTLGTLIGVASKADMLDKDGKLPRIKGALLADAIATSAGAVLGTSTTTTYVESASGVTEGGRTGLTSLTTAVMFIIAIFLSPIFLAIPGFATAPALIIVGFYMIAAVVKINFENYAEAIPAFLCIAAMPFSYSISEGIAVGVISYTLINLVTGKESRKKLTPLMYVLTVLFILKYIFCST